MIMRAHSLVHVLVLALFGLATPLHAQSLADRVSSVGNGAVTFHFAPRPGLCGDGEHFIRTGRSSYHGSFSHGFREELCVVGPVQVRLTVRDGVVERVQSWAGPLRPREARDLGAVPAAEAILPAVLADSGTVWPSLLAVARDTETRSRATRQDALFWLSRFASGAVAGHRNQPFEMEDERDSDDEDLKSHAVFVLSQLPNGGGITPLLEIARSNPSRHVRSKALFWLGQSGDPRAIALFEAVLR
jgi:hypothetical protein